MTIEEIKQLKNMLVKYISVLDGDEYRERKNAEAVIQDIKFWLDAFGEQQ